MHQQTKIFFSYRRSDNPDFVDRIRDWFSVRYGRENVFMDFDTIPPMVRFADFIRKEIEQCDAVIVVIGPRWLQLMREKASNFDEDYVRIEIELALQLGKPIAPICIMGALMPSKSDLPSDLHSLLAYNAAFLERSNFLDRIEHVILSVEQTLDQNKSREAQELFERAETKWRAGNHEGAIGDATRAIQLKPNFFLAYNRRGTAHIAKNEFDAAILDFNVSIRLAPEFPYSYYNRGIVYQSQNKYDEAIADYSRAIDLDPEYAYAYIRRGVAWDDKGDHARAIADFSEAIRLSPEYAATYFHRGVALNAKNDFRGALADFKQYVARKGWEEYDNREKVENWIRDLEEKLK